MKNLILAVAISLLFQISFAQNISIPDSLQSEITDMDLRQQFDYFIGISNEMRSINAQNALYFAELTDLISKKLNKIEFKQKSILALVKAHEALSNYDTAIIFSKQILAGEEEMDEALRMQFISNLGNSYLGKGTYPEAKESLETAIHYYKEKGDSLSVYELASSLGRLFSSLGDYPNSVKSYQRALNISEYEADTNKIILQYSKMGHMYMKLEDFVAARSYYFNGLAISKNYEKSMSFKTLLSYIGSYYSRMHVLDSALIFQERSLKITKALGKQDDIAGSYLNIGNLYCRTGDFEKGKACYDTALRVFRKLNLDVNIGKVYDSYSVMYGVQKKYDSSLYYAKKVLEIGRKTKDSRSIQSSLYRIASAYDRLQDYKNGLKYAKQFIFYNDSIMGEETRAKVAELETKYETAKKERDIIKLKAEKKAQQDKELILWISFIGVLAILLLIVWFIIQKRKKDKIIYQQEQLVLKKEKALADVELEKSKLQEEELKNEIQYKSKQLTTHALNMMQKNTLMQEIQDELVVVSKKANAENKPVLNRIKMLLKRNLQSEKDWDLFKLYFEDVNKNFYDALAKLNPELTPNDLKICALLKLNLNIKESASVLNIEPASVKTARYKLRKKLNLNPEDDLIEFIRKIG